MVKSPTVTVTARSPSGGTRRFGWRFLAATIGVYHDPANLAKAYWGTLPYPTAVYIMGNLGTGLVSSDLAWWEAFCQASEAYNAEVILNFAIDGSNQASLDGFNTAVVALSKYSVVKGLGVNYEYPHGVPHPTAQQMLQLGQEVISNGKLFMNRYLPDAIRQAIKSLPSYLIGNAPWPYQGTQNALLAFQDPDVIGFHSMEDYVMAFPETRPLPAPNVNLAGLNYGWSDNPPGAGSIDETIATAAMGIPSLSLQAPPESTRQYVFFNSGQDSVYFIGVSGVNTVMFFDHPVFRQVVDAWLSANPGYYARGM